MEKKFLVINFLKDKTFFKTEVNVEKLLSVPDNS